MVRRSRHRSVLPRQRRNRVPVSRGSGACRAPSTVRRRLYAIRKVHRLLRLPDPTHDEDIYLTFRRVRRANAVRPRQAKGLTRQYLDKFLESEPDSPWGLRNRAMLSLGYELLTRRSELVALRNSEVTLRADGTMRVLIRRSKQIRLERGGWPLRPCGQLTC